MIFFIFLLSAFQGVFGYLIPPAEITIFESRTSKFYGAQNEIDFLTRFPYHQYKIRSVRQGGSFYIDDPKLSIKSELWKGIAWEPEVQRLIERSVIPNSTAIDIGAHIGTHTITMSRCVGKEGSVIAFEPQMKMFAELAGNLKLNWCENVTAYRCALGDSSKSIQMNKANQNEGGTSIGSGGNYALMLPLDELNLTNISFIKIDAENTEDQVLQGARKTIASNRPIMVIEIMGNDHPFRNERLANTIHLIESMNYKVSHFNCRDYLAVPNK